MWSHFKKLIRYNAVVWYCNHGVNIVVLTPGHFFVM